MILTTSKFYISKRTHLRLLLQVLLILLCNPLLFAAKWNTYTNTNNVTDVVMVGDGEKIYSATWGGIAVYEKNQSAVPGEPFANYSKTMTSVDGLSSNDIRTLAYEAERGDLWAGSANDGITIIKSNGMQILNTNSGLPSNKVRRIVVHQSYIYVATDLGISQFYYLPGVYIPLLLHQYNANNTQGGLASNDVRDIAVSEQGYLYCATASGLSFVHTDSLDIDAAWHKWTYDNSPLPNAPILSISVSQNYVAMNSMTSVHRHNINPFDSDWQTWTRTTGLQDSVFTSKVFNSGLITLAYGFWNEDIMTLSRITPYVIASISQPGYVEHGISPPANEPLPEVCIYRIAGLGFDKYAYASWGEGIFIHGNSFYSHLEDNCIGFQTISEIKTDKNYKIWFGSGWVGGTMTRKGTRGVSSWSNGIWQNFSTRNSPITIDNMMSVDVDQNNKKWFGSWDSTYEPFKWRPGVIVYDDAIEDWKWYTRFGIRQWSPETGWSEPLTGTPRLLNNTIAEVSVDKKGNILITCAEAGIIAFDKDYNYLGSFRIPESFSINQWVTSIYHSGTRYFFGTYNDRSLIIWDSDTLPLEGGDHWVYPPTVDLYNSYIYGTVTSKNVFGDEENWFATSSGLYMWNGTDWYKYGRDIKARIWKNGNWSSSTTDGAILYYVDEKRLFASAETTPTAIFLDPFNRIWIGSMGNGFSMYDPDSERFTNYYQEISPLLSNYITCFGYDPILGNLLIGTPDGLNTLEIGVQVKTEKQLHTVKAFPNPFFPDTDGFVQIVNLPSKSMPVGTNVCKIYDTSGQLVVELKENLFARFDWNGQNKNAKNCSSGIYYFVVTTAKGETKRGKIALVR